MDRDMDLYILLDKGDGTICGAVNASRCGVSLSMRSLYLRLCTRGVEVHYGSGSGDIDLSGFSSITFPLMASGSSPVVTERGSSL